MDLRGHTEVRRRRRAGGALRTDALGPCGPGTFASDRSQSWAEAGLGLCVAVHLARYPAGLTVVTGTREIRPKEDGGETPEFAGGQLPAPTQGVKPPVNQGVTGAVPHTRSDLRVLPPRHVPTHSPRPSESGWAHVSWSGGRSGCAGQRGSTRKYGGVPKMNKSGAGGAGVTGSREYQAGEDGTGAGSSAAGVSGVVWARASWRRSARPASSVDPARSRSSWSSWAVNSSRTWSKLRAFGP